MIVLDQACQHFRVKVVTDDDDDSGEVDNHRMMAVHSWAPGPLFLVFE
jgi:hypothetical protein